MKRKGKPRKPKFNRALTFLAEWETAMLDADFKAMMAAWRSGIMREGITGFIFDDGSVALVSQMDYAIMKGRA